MKHEAEFASYLTTAKKSSKTNRPYSIKVAGDTVSRCKAVERNLCFELSPKSAGSDAAVQKLVEAIKGSRIGTSDKLPYAYNAHILAVRLYREFLNWRDSH